MAYVHENYLHLECRVLKPDGTAIGNNDAVVPVNQVSVGGFKVSGNTETYPYRAYLEALLNYDKGQESGDRTSEKLPLKGKRSWQ